MSVLIKGMEAPTRCKSCPMCVEDCGYGCAISDEDIFNYRYDGKSPNCLIDPVPPHGRLIDADVLIATFCEWSTCLERGLKLVITVTEAKQAIVDIINAAPTIIEAEEGE